MHHGDLELEMRPLDDDVPPVARHPWLLGPGLGLAILVLFILLAAAAA